MKSANWRISASSSTVDSMASGVPLPVSSLTDVGSLLLLSSNDDVGAEGGGGGVAFLNGVSGFSWSKTTRFERILVQIQLKPLLALLTTALQTNWMTMSIFLPIFGKMDGATRWRREPTKKMSEAMEQVVTIHEVDGGGQSQVVDSVVWLAFPWRKTIIILPFWIYFSKLLFSN